MKKIIFAAACSLLTSLGSGYAQNIETGLAINLPLNKPVFSSPPADLINARAAKDFYRRHTGITNAKWSIIKDGSVAMYTAGNKLTRVYYNSKGQWHFTITCYDETVMPSDLRNTVMANYPCYAINVVQEIALPGKLVYLVSLKNNAYWKIARIENGEVEELESFQR